MSQYKKVQSDQQTVCILCRKFIDYDEICAVGEEGSKVAGRVLCLSCHDDPERQKKENRLHNVKVKKIAEKSPRQKRHRQKLINKNKSKFIPPALRGSSVLRQEYLDDMKRYHK